MKNRVLLVFLAMALVVSLVAFAACAKEEEAPPVEEEAPPVEEEAPPVEEEEEEVWQWPERLLLMSYSPQSPIYGAQIAWSTPLSKDTGMKIRIICEANPHLGMLWTKEGRFFTVAPHQSRAMLYGTKGWARRDGGPWQSRIWMPCGKSYYSFCVLGDSGIKTPYDIKPGMKAIYMTLGEEAQQLMMGLLAWGQVDPEDVTWVPLGATAQSARFLMDRKGDFLLGYITSGCWFEAEAGPHGLSWIELDWEKDPEGAQRFLNYFPWADWGIATGGVPSSEGVPMCASIAPYITSAETDPELVYRIVKWLDENYDRYKDSAPWCATTTIDNLMELAESHYEPLHDGSVRYLEEIGRWTEELEARRQYNIEQMTKWVEAYQTAIDMADGQGIVVDPDSDEWQEFWENYRDSLNLPFLVNFQGPGKEQPTHTDFYQEWERVRLK